MPSDEIAGEGDEARTADKVLESLRRIFRTLRRTCMWFGGHLGASPSLCLTSQKNGKQCSSRSERERNYLL